jgi:hypothetical protein
MRGKNTHRSSDRKKNGPTILACSNFAWETYYLGGFREEAAIRVSRIVRRANNDNTPEQAGPADLSVRVSGLF